MNRALRAATMGALLISPVALTACSAGQVTQTASQDRDQVGAMAQAGSISLRQVVIAYPEDEVHEAGDDVELNMTIVNGDVEDDTLVSIDGEGFDGVLVEEQDDTSPVAQPGAPATTPQPSADVDITIPAGSAITLGEDGDVQVLLADLAEDLTVAQSLPLTLTFERAGEIEVRAIVDTPGRALERPEAFDFHEEEEDGSEQGSEEAAREREDAAGGGTASD